MITEQEIINVVKKYEYLHEFCLHEPKIVRQARNKGKLFWENCTEKLKRKRQKHKLQFTPEQLYEISSKYATKMEWKNKHPQSYYYALQFERHVFNECGKRMKRPPPVNKFPNVSKEDCLKSAQSCKSAPEWKQKFHIHWVVAKRYGKEFLKKCTEHMIYDERFKSIYVFEFHNHFAYVGVSRNPESRRGSHLKSGPVADHIKTCHNYNWKILMSEIENNDIAALIEETCRHFYAENGWTMLNRSKYFKSNPSVKKRYTDEDIRSELLKFKRKNDARNENPEVFTQAYKRGPDFFKECTAHMPRWAGRKNAVYATVTDGEILNSTVGYISFSQWGKDYGNFYQIARQRRPELFKKCKAAIMEHKNLQLPATV